MRCVSIRGKKALVTRRCFRHWPGDRAAAGARKAPTLFLVDIDETGMAETAAEVALHGVEVVTRRCECR